MKEIWKSQWNSCTMMAHPGVPFPTFLMTAGTTPRQDWRRVAEEEGISGEGISGPPVSSSVEACGNPHISSRRNGPLTPAGPRHEVQF